MSAAFAVFSVDKLLGQEDLIRIAEYTMAKIY